MPVDPEAAIEVTAFSSVPPIARGLVRDLRVRWVLEELGRPYRTRLYDRMPGGVPAPDFVIPDHPFSQVPGLVDGEVAMFESGAICLRLAEDDERLMPRDEPQRARTLSWAFAALSSIEPFVMHHQIVTAFDRDKPGAADYAPQTAARLRRRLEQLGAALGDKEWLCDRFTVADIVMVHVLLPGSVAEAGMPANLSAYVARGKARPAYQRAFDAQIADFTRQEESA